MDWLSVGLNPGKSHIIHSVERPRACRTSRAALDDYAAQLAERVPTYKEQIENLKDRDLGTYGFLGYPLLQSADIVMYGEPKQELLVPVGEDQAPHVELTREVVRRFDTHLGS